jgi:hypothetical protein
MGTITKTIADAIMAGDYKDDSFSKIVVYRNMFDGRLTYAIVFKDEDQQKYEKSPACDYVQTVWTAP